jgi:hypothetical protein
MIAQVRGWLAKPEVVVVLVETHEGSDGGFNV